MRDKSFLLVLTLLLALIAPVSAAWAHAQLLSTDPAANAVLESAPQAVRLHFNEPVSPLAISLIGSDGAEDAEMPAPSLELLPADAAGH
ncbi:MAG TPA: copper resistance protein CopC [Devosia sp.]|nr:copper resistance protein CopC [Devosia sp.]